MDRKVLYNNQLGDGGGNGVAPRNQRGKECGINIKFWMWNLKLVQFPINVENEGSLL